MTVVRAVVVATMSEDEKVHRRRQTMSRALSLSSRALGGGTAVGAERFRGRGRDRGRRRARVEARNRILFEPHECDAEACALRREDARAGHIRDVLRAGSGAHVRVGVVNGGKYDGIVEEHAEDGGMTVRLGAEEASAEASAYDVDVLLAMPRPKVLRRLWAPLASLGIARIVLVNANKVERYYFDSSALDVGTIRGEILRGLEQAGDTRVPQVGVGLRLPPVVDRVSGVLSSEDPKTNGFEWLLEGQRGWTMDADVLLLAHPGQGRTSVADALEHARGKRVLLAIGPEGGWTDYELDLFENAGFKRVGLGSRTFTTDVACISLVSAVRERQQSWLT